ncbi:hypothetical protein M404DRAFT_611539 [Pisolithus tinctorius Marx 270]|uniref:SLC26A/SulP transporter domain-containing protein n=1 Tax=Pisolithus tinctorius Marx 270 TaxID=870435 RepID=A0A0C3P816_PISTI|nr:hypothetical protein M404DRAFT_611539 [Pisolithus tinctorius Marx 270]
MLRRDGWLFDSAGTTGSEGWYEFYTYFDLGLIKWIPTWNTLPTQYRHEQGTRRAWVAEFGSGFLGSVPNYLVYVITLMFYRVGGGNRIAGLMLALVTLFILLVGTAPVAYIPFVVVGALIFALGIDLVEEALWDTRYRVSWTEYVTIVSIMVTMTVAFHDWSAVRDNCQLCFLCRTELAAAEYSSMLPWQRNHVHCPPSCCIQGLHPRSLETNTYYPTTRFPFLWNDRAR